MSEPAKARLGHTPSTIVGDVLLMAAPPPSIGDAS